MAIGGHGDHATAAERIAMKVRNNHVDLGADVEALRNELGRLCEHVGAIGKAMERLTGDAGVVARESTEAAFRDAGEGLGSAINGLESRVGASPLASLATAFGTGVLLGMFFDRRR
jgi:hypothetical protein